MTGQIWIQGTLNLVQGATRISTRSSDLAKLNPKCHLNYSNYLLSLLNVDIPVWKSYSYKFQQPQKNHFSVDRPFLIHVITKTHNKARKSGL